MSFFGDLLAGDAAAKASNYNAGLIERDANLTEQQAEQGYKVFQQFDLPRFDYYAEKQKGALQTSFAGAGVEFSGSASAGLLPATAPSSIKPSKWPTSTVSPST